LKKVVHFLKPSGLSLGVFNSQVLKLSNAINQKYKHIDTRTWVPADEKNKHHAFPTYRKVLRRRDVNNGDVLYIRSALDYFLHRLMFVGKNIKFIYDFRALVAFESWYRNRNIFRLFFLFLLEGFAYYTAHQVNAVSKKLSQKLQKFYKKSRCINIVPCLADKVEKRKEGDTESYNFVYIGGTSKWQCIDQMFSLFAKIKKYIPNSTFTVYTKKEDIISSYADKYDLEISCLYVEQEQVFTELKKYDFGFLLREKHIINEVASPIKFLEYLSAGVIPIVTKWVGDYSEIVAEKDIGVIADLNDSSINSLIEKIKAVRQDPFIHKRIFNYVNNMTWSNFDQDFINDDIIH
jgi:glycosyltransferase involved in cell wall biosynthesis